MILDIILLAIIIIIIGASTIDYRGLIDRIQEIQDEIRDILSKIPSVFSITIILMSSILVMSFLVALVPKY